MARISDIQNRLKSINISDISVESIDETKDVFLEINKEQLLAGKTKKGVDITPSYIDDPYFKTPGAAQRYSAWKDKITPSDIRTPGTPNLYINGTFHESISINVSGPIINISASFKGNEIENKYTSDIFGLGGDFKTKYVSEDLIPVFLRKVRQATGL